MIGIDFSPTGYRQNIVVTSQCTVSLPVKTTGISSISLALEGCVHPLFVIRKSFKLPNTWDHFNFFFSFDTLLNVSSGFCPCLSDLSLNYSGNVAMSIPFPSGQVIRIKKVSIKGILWNWIQIIRNSHNERCKAESNENFSSSVAFVKDYFYLSTAPDKAGQIKLKGDAPSVHLIWYTQGKNFQRLHQDFSDDSYFRKRLKYED